MEGRERLQKASAKVRCTDPKSYLQDPGNSISVMSRGKTEPQHPRSITQHPQNPEPLAQALTLNPTSTQHPQNPEPLAPKL